MTSADTETPISAAAKEAAGDTLKAFIIPIAAVVSLAVGVLTLLAGEPRVTALAFGAMTMLAILAAFLYFFNDRLRTRLKTALNSKDTLLNEQRQLEVRAVTAEQKAKDRDEVQARLEKEAARASLAEAKAAGLESEKTRLVGDIAAMAKEREELRAALARAIVERASADSALVQSKAQLEQLAGELATERLSTARASLLPLLRPGVEVVPAGWFKPNNVNVFIENVGKGNASLVQLSGGGGTGKAPVPTTAISYYPAVKPGERMTTTLGSVDDFGGAEWVGVQVTYSGPFGPMSPTGIRRSLR
jgi:hypothetical protein